MEHWMIWISVGVIFMIIEIFTPGFYFLSIGLGAIITGLVALTHPPFWVELVSYIIITFILFLNLRKISKKLMADEVPSNVNALLGKKGIVTSEITESTRGSVKIGGEEWSAVSLDGSSLEIGKKIVVTAIDGNKLIVKNNEEV